LENDFAPGESTPINVVVQARGDILQPDNLLALDQLARDIAATPGV